MNMMEKVARAITDAMYQGEISDDAWNGAHQQDRETALSWACAAIEAMRDPSEKMIVTGYDATRLEDGYPQFSKRGFCLGHASKIYTAMIHAALSGDD